MTTEAPEKVAAATTTTTTEAETPRTAEQEAADDAQFGAGFKQVHGEEDSPRAESRPAEPAKVEPPKVEAKTDKPAPAAPAKTDVVTEQPQVVFAKASDVEDLKRLIATNHDKAFGRFGELGAAIKAAQGASGQPVKVTKEMLKRLDAEGFGELAAALAEDLNGLVLGASQASSFDQTAYDKAVDEKVAAATTKLEKATEKKLLGIAHPDWNACFHADDFKVWRATLSAEAQQVIDHSWDSASLSGALADFKDWRVKKADAAKAAEAKAKADAAALEATKKRDQRLEAAITPQGGGQPSGAPNEEDAFLTGFAGARSG